MENLSEDIKLVASENYEFANRPKKILIGAFWMFGLLPIQYMGKIGDCSI